MYYSEKKVQLIRNYLHNRDKPILIIMGPTGSGKFTCVLEILKYENYDTLYVSPYISNDYFKKDQNSLMFALNQQLESVKQKEAIIMRDIDSPPLLELKLTLNKYRNVRVDKPLIIILNSSIIRHFQLVKILPQEFLNQFCTIQQFIPPTKKKMSQFIRDLNPHLSEAQNNEINELSNGDMGCAKSLVYLSKLSRSNIKVSKDNSIGLFHSLGRVLYNKRKDVQGMIASQSVVQFKSKQLQYYFDPFDLVDQMPITQQSYRQFIHTNYLKFCPDINNMAKIADLFCEMDMHEQFNFYNERDINQKEANDHLFSAILTLGYMEINHNMNTQGRQMIPIQGPFHYSMQQRRKAVKEIIKGCRKPTEAQMIFKILKKNYPKPQRLTAVSLSDETDCQEEWLVDEFEQKQTQKPLLHFAVMKGQRDLLSRPRYLPEDLEELFK